MIQIKKKTSVRVPLALLTHSARDESLYVIDKKFDELDRKGETQVDTEQWDSIKEQLKYINLVEKPTKIILGEDWFRKNFSIN